jgi:hypothetical protein
LSALHPACEGTAVTKELDQLGPRDFVTGCLVVGVVLLVVPFLVIMFKISFYLAVIIGVFLAVILGVALLGRVLRILFARMRSRDYDRRRLP